jgi:hypothetical protein
MDANVLGCLPQQLRGNLSRFDVNVIGGQGYSQCTACSSKVWEAPIIALHMYIWCWYSLSSCGYQVRGMYKTSRDELLRGAMNELSFLEDLTGLTAMYKELDNFEFVDDWELSDEDDDDDDDGMAAAAASSGAGVVTEV